jgi:hypothetical protein
MSLVDSKSILAKLMATENLIVEQRNVTTASFDVKNRVLTVPTLDNNISSNLYDLFMGHEVGHALYTPLEGMMEVHHSNIQKSIVNVVEDVRIERKIKSRYPGLKNSFLKGYKELNDRDFFDTKNKNLNFLNFIDRINLHFKCGVNQGIKFNQEERDLIKEVESTETFEDVIVVSQKIIDYMKKQQEENKKNVKLLNDDLTDDFEMSDDILFDDDHEQNDTEDMESSGDPNSKESDSDIGDFDEESEDELKDDLVGNSSFTEEEIKSFTDEAYRKNESQLFAEKGTRYNYVNIPKVDIEKVILDYKTLYQKYKHGGYRSSEKKFIEYRRESSRVVSYLVKEFEMRKNAEQLKRASTSKTGELNLNKIFSYQFNEDIFKKITVVPGAKSHGLIMFLDWSGSMSNHIGNTVKQLLNLVFFCKKVNIPFEVYSFIGENGNEFNYSSEQKPGELYIDDFFLANILSSRMSASEFTFAGGALMNMSGNGDTYISGVTPPWLKMYGTPLNESIISAMEIIPEFQKKYKLQIVNTIILTDGDGGYISSFFNKDLKYSDVGYDEFRNRVSDVVLVDPVTKNQERYKNMYGNSWLQTNALISLLKKRTNSNVIGFYVASQREFVQNLSKFYGSSMNTEQTENIKNKFRKEKFTVVDTTAFDDYYILRSNSLNTEEDADFVVKENVTRRGLVTAFSKYTNARVNNRVILNRFIGLIA